MEYWRGCREFQHSAWSDGVVIYDTACGDTHHLTLTAFQVLHQIHKAPCTQEQLANYVRLSEVTGVDDESLEMIDAILAHLAKIGLIESIPH